jgi:dolichol-phosphate mannosyltransferase
MLSVIVPVFNEEDNIKTLIAEIVDAARYVPISEIIYVDDASTDGTRDCLRTLRETYPMLRIVSHIRQSGQSAALWTGIMAAGNDLIVTLDGDGQNDPTDIPLLMNTYTQALNQGYNKVMVVGERKKRHDNLTRIISSRCANGIRSWLLKDRTPDTGCSLKLFSRRAYLNLPYFDHMHRFLPALMQRDQVKVFHVPISHRPRLYGSSKYGTFDRMLVGISDLIGVLWLQKRARRSFDAIEEV